MNNKQLLIRQCLQKTVVGRGLLLMIVSLFLSACGGESAEQKLLLNVAHNIITPAYVELDVQAVELVKQSAAFCQATKDKEILQQQWRKTMVAWARVQAVSFGPIEDANLRWKLQFWPDRKDLTRKKVEALIASKDLLSAERIATASVSAKGLAALEYLLFDQRGGALDRYREGPQAGRRCELLLATATRVQQVTQQLAVQWRGGDNRAGYADKFASPGANNSVYPDNNSALAQLLDTLIVGAEVVKRNKLGIALAVDKGVSHAKPYRLEAWRSQYSLALMRANVAVLEQLYRGAGGYGLVNYLAEERAIDAALLLAIDEDFSGINSQFATLETPLFTTLKLPQQYAALTVLHQRLQRLGANLNQLPERLGISLGFNSNDGD
jgi:uncharacterized protein